MSEKRIKALIVDDEPLARRYIRTLLENDDAVVVIGECGNGAAAAKFVRERSPDLVFLDVQMPEMDGFTMLTSLGSKSPPAIIFTTAFEEFAVRAFEVHALDYLLKPFDRERFEAAVAHAKTLLADKRDEPPEAVQIAELLKHVAARPAYIDRLLIKRDGRILFLKTADIDLVKADGKYLQIHSGSHRYLVRQTMRSLKSQLDPAKFVQIHRSVIVPVEKIVELQPMGASEYIVVLANGSKHPLSRNFKDETFSILGHPI
jgi:two-component system LytT family response regulator